MTASMLDYQLRRQYCTSRPGKWNGTRPIREVRLWEDSPCKSDVLNVALFQQKRSGQSALTVIEQSSYEALTQKNGWFLICGDGAYTSAVNEVFRAFHQFLHWREQIRILASVEFDLGGLLSCSSRYLNVDLNLVGKQHEIILGSNYSDDPKKGDLMSRLYIQDPRKEDLIEQLYLQDPDFDETFQTDGLTRYHYGELQDHTIYYCNIRMEDGHFLSRLLMVFRREYDCPGLRAFLEQLIPQVCICYTHIYKQDLQARHKEKATLVLKQHLRGEPVEEKLLYQQLYAFGWLPEQRYQIMVLKTTGYINSEQTLNYFAAQMEERFPSCLALCIGGSICCIRNLDQDQPRDFRNELSCFLRENLFRAGISNPFSGILNCRTYLAQAEDALNLGLKSNPDLWRYDFSDFLYEYILKKLTEEYPAQDLYSPGLKKIKQYDKEKPSAQLEETLRQYFLCQFNASEAAQRLFIHRTTFIYRINKIEQISGIDLQDWKEVLGLMIAFSCDRDFNAGK